MLLTESIVYQVWTLIIKTKMDKHVREFRLNCLYKAAVTTIWNECRSESSKCLSSSLKHKLKYMFYKQLQNPSCEKKQAQYK